MHIEYEARVLEVDKEKLEKKLISLRKKKVADFENGLDLELMEIRPLLQLNK